jgi:hypothetical protein
MLNDFILEGTIQKLLNSIFKKNNFESNFT